MKRKILFTAMVMLIAAQVARAQSIPRYYELVTADKNPFESGKYYVIVAIPEAGTFSYRMAYNGINTNHTGNAGRVTPNELHEQPGITPTSFSRILDIEKEGNHAVPLKIVKNESESTARSINVYNLIDASVGTSNLVIGVNAATTGDSQHYLIGDAESTKDDPYHLWTISFATEDSELRAFIRDVGKTYYLKYDDNNYGADNSFFRVYASPTSEKRNVMLYKEMETKTAATSFTGHGTLYYSNKVLMVPEGVTAARTYTFNNTDNRVYSNKEYATEYLIPANSAVIFRGEKSTTYTFPVTTLHNPTRDGDNILRGFDAAGTTTSGTSDDSKYYFYKLTTQNHVESSVGFYWGATNGAPFTSAAHKAYLALLIDDAKNARSFLLNDIETPTSITPTTITHHPSPDGYVYDLTGRRFSSTQSLPKGIYISNGKKFVVK